MSMRSLGHRKHNGLGVVAAAAATVAAAAVVAASTRGRSVDVGEPEVFLVVGIRMRRRLCWPRWPEWIDDGDRLVTAVQSHDG